MRACQLISEGVMRPPALIARPGFPRRDARPSPSRDMPSLCRWYGQRSGPPSSTCCRISIRSPPSPRNEVPRQLGHPSRADARRRVERRRAEPCRASRRSRPGNQISTCSDRPADACLRRSIDLVVYMIEKACAIAVLKAPENLSDVVFGDHQILLYICEQLLARRRTDCPASKHRTVPPVGPICDRGNFYGSFGFRQARLPCAVGDPYSRVYLHPRPPSRASP